MVARCHWCIWCPELVSETLLFHEVTFCWEWRPSWTPPHHNRMSVAMAPGFTTVHTSISAALVCVDGQVWDESDVHMALQASQTCCCLHSDSNSSHPCFRPTEYSRFFVLRIVGTSIKATCLSFKYRLCVLENGKLDRKPKRNTFLCQRGASHSSSQDRLSTTKKSKWLVQ